jgi:FAD/FMN-containing dehydrogenase/Fe-S oxidoreductase
MTVDATTVGSIGSEAERERLGAEMARRVRGDVWFDGGRRAIYATDSSNYRQVPLGVVCPRDEDDVLEVLSICQDAGAPVLGRGAGTSLAGQSCNVAVVLDMSRHMNRIVSIDPDRRQAIVQPGVVLDDLRREAGRYGLTFGPDPATHAWCTIGGMVGNNSCGTHALYAGKTVDNVERLKVATYRGAQLELGAYDAAAFENVVARGGEEARILSGLAGITERFGELVRRRFPPIARRVSGYNLDELLPERGFHVARALVGTESTCALVTEATLTLVTSPRHRRLVVLAYEDVYTAADHVPEVLTHGLLGLEGFDELLVRQMREANLNVRDLELLPPGGGWLLAEVGSDDEDEAQARAETVAAAAPGGARVAIFAGAAEQAAIWRVRESGLGATARPPGRAPNHEGWEDAAVAPERLGEYLRGVRDLWAEHGYSGAWYGHFGQGCVHTRNDFDFRSEAGLRRYRAFVEQAADLCIGLGGSLSGEHGDGQARGELLEKMFGSELVGAFREFKAIWDPDNKMNPGKVVDARPLDADLRYGPTYRDVSLGRTRFSLRADGGDLQRAAERCVGVGRCRRDDSGVMCPSFRATRDEVHSTRGRAKLLVEMFQGEVTPATWRNEEVFEALDLCLSCKGCAVDCPTHVDMASYKAEFLSHYYAGRLRPLHAYALGLIPWWSRIATRIPRLANLALADHGTGRLAKRLLGIATSRPTPAYARRSFRREHPERVGAQTTSTVVLWPDTFSDVYLPERANAALVLLRSAGEDVAVPTKWACCGRPLFDSGMLAMARRSLRQVLDVLGPYLERGVPVVVVEPSCLATFRDELPDLLADDPRAARLAGLARSLAEHLDATGWQPQQPLDGIRAVVHPHCHQRAVAGSEADRRVLERAGCSVEILDAGCCGLAGSFGFVAKHDELSRRIGNERFAPALNNAAGDPGARLVLDGFSCATQAEHLGASAGTSLAELLAETITPAPHGAK